MDVPNRQVFLVLTREVHRARSGVRLIRKISNAWISEPWLVAIANRQRRQVVHHLVARTPRVNQGLTDNGAVLPAHKVVLRDGDNVFRQALQTQHKGFVTVKAHRTALRTAHQTRNGWWSKRCRNAEQIPFKELGDINQLGLAIRLFCLDTVGLNDGIRVDSAYILLCKRIPGCDMRPVGNCHRNPVIWKLLELECKVTDWLTKLNVATSPRTGSRLQE